MAEQEHADDLRCVRAIRAGDAEAFAPLMRRHLPSLHALLRRFFRDNSDVDDIAQAALIRAYEQLDRYDATRPFYPWLRRIAVNLALHEIERRKRRRELADSEPSLEQIVADDRSERRVEQAELQACTEEALESLPPQWAAVFRLRAFEDLSYAEIAATLEIPVGTVMSSLARTRTHLAETLSKRFGPLKEMPS